MTRGIRNHNPGNINYLPANQWQGQLPINKAIEPRFCRFISPEYGIRALIKLLQTYHNKGYNTVNKMINRWAPPNENGTQNYINYVATRLNMAPNDKLNPFDKNTAFILAKAIIQYENGAQPYDNAVFERAYRLL
ncbi:structural protein [Arsenophonus apicola]|uniref:Structural protein n=1 Tax=Arsenophonus apicola TaxID=2879119 RepID=A0ABY8P5A8_9GAMM|nr:structural protein [Arsenophonus apicola]WGO84677.1 structural protein [Arsenophonus apicola]